ncbi:MAG: DEAD/DEAH box helicase [Promethearchaeota archaeon]
MSILPFLIGKNKDILKYIRDKKVLEILIKNNIRNLRDIQRDAIIKGLFFRQNFLICTPSGSGKTLIGELAIINNIFINPDCVGIYIVPYKALAVEKHKYFTKNYSKYNLRAAISIGDTEIDIEEIRKSNVLITTFEKLDSILRNFRYNDPWLINLGVVVIDEIHVMGDFYRGSRLESLIIRLLMNYDLQMICLSATISNPDNFGGWLNSLSLKYGKKSFKIIIDKKRPIELEYKIQKMENKVAGIRQMLKKCLSEQGQALIFSYSRKSTEKNAEIYKKTVRRYLTQHEKEYLIKMQNKLAKIPAHSKILKELLPFGVGFHHAGLQSKEKKILEDLYNKKFIKLICCTTTLAAGVNMPARLVILKDFKQKVVNNPSEQQLVDGVATNRLYELPSGSNGYFIPYNNNQVFQLLGRAGRPNMDIMGIGVICVNNEEEENWVREHYFFYDEKQNKLIPKYSPIISSFNKIGALREQILLIIYHFKKIGLNKITEFFENSYFAYNLNLPPNISLSKYLRLQYPDSLHFLYLHADNSKILKLKYEIKELRFDEIREDKVICSFKTNQWFRIQFNIESGIYCSCGKLIQPEKLTFNNLIRINYNFCNHLITLLSFINYIASKYSNINHSTLNQPRLLSLNKKYLCYPIALRYINDIMINVLKCERILDFLIEHGFITEENNTFEITSIGELTIKLYLRPEDVIFIRSEFIESENPPNNINSVLKSCYKYLNFQGKWTEKNYLDAIIQWINETSLEKILQLNPYITGGDFYAFREDIIRTLAHINSIADFYGNIELADMAQILIHRVKHGIHEELIDIVCRLPDVGRKTARRLYNADYKTVVDIWRSNPEKIHFKTYIPLNTAKKIFKNAILLKKR